MTDVSFHRSDYAYHLPDWQLVSDVCDGERAVKGDRRDVVQGKYGTVSRQYLPMPNPDDESTANKKRYGHYLQRAVFYNATGRTLQALTGTAYRTEPAMELPAGLEFLREDAGGDGVGLLQQSQSTLANVLKHGRAGLLVDYPNSDGAITEAQRATGDIRATLTSYKAADVINWRCEHRGGRIVLSLVVLSEIVDNVTGDGFGSEECRQYRVLDLIDGVYSVRIWRECDGGWQEQEAYEPRQGNGARWDFIPFVFVGAKNNDHTIDTAPLHDLACVNIAHFRNSADYEDSAFFCGQAQPWISGLDQTWRDHLEQQGLYIGSRTPLLLPEGGAFGFAQVQPNTLAKEAMQSKEDQMIALGARLIEQSERERTATETRSDDAAQHSVLSLVANNVNDAYQKALAWAAIFENVTGEIVFEIATNYEEHSLDAQLLTALVSAWQSNALPQSDLWSQLRKRSVIYAEKTDEEIRDELAVNPQGLALDGA